MELLKQHEELSLFPPHFILNISNIEHSRATSLDTNITVTLYNNIEERKPPQTFMFKLFVPISATAINRSAGLSEVKFPPSIDEHDCDKNKVEYIHLIKYSENIAHRWQEIAVELGIPYTKISIIDIDHPYVQMKCYIMFKIWLERTSPCWCKFIQALYAVGLYSVAEEVKTHLKLRDSAGETLSDINVAEEASMDLESPEGPRIASSDIKETKSNSETENDQVKLHDLMQFVRRIQSCDLNDFICHLLPDDRALSVINDIKCNSNSLSEEDILQKICETFLNEKDPSWTKVLRAFKEAEYDNLAQELNSWLVNTVEDKFLTENVYDTFLHM